MIYEEAVLCHEALHGGAKELPDEKALKVPFLYDPWAVGLHCVKDERYTYEGNLYRCEQTHDAQEGWEPPKVPALFTNVAEPGTIPVWVQPTGAQDAYMTGDKVHYPTADDPVYISTIDNNVWAPDVTGWELA